jgi:hypothetical protein
MEQVGYDSLRIHSTFQTRILVSDKHGDYRTWWQQWQNSSQAEFKNSVTHGFFLLKTLS